jgi:cell division protein FtsN
MAKFERYDARDDARIFDGGEIEEEDEEGSRLPLLLVLGLLVAAAFSGVVWFAYTQGVQRGRADAPRMLVAAEGPVKEAPANPGGTATPYTGLKIYQQPAPADDDDAESAPQPPTPKAVPAPQAVKVAQASPAPTGALPKAVQSAPQPLATKPPRALHPAAATDSVPSLKPATLPPLPAKAAPKKPMDAQVPKPVKPTIVAATEAPPPAAHPGLGTVLQIGAYKSEDEASAAWKAFVRKHQMASAYQSDIRKVDLGDKGVWYRLRLGTFAGKTEAVAFCDKLKADGGNCFLAR